MTVQPPLIGEGRVPDAETVNDAFEPTSTPWCWNEVEGVIRGGEATTVRCATSLVTAPSRLVIDDAVIPAWLVWTLVRQRLVSVQSARSDQLPLSFCHW